MCTPSPFRKPSSMICLLYRLNYACILWKYVGLLCICVFNLHKEEKKILIDINRIYWLQNYYMPHKDVMRLK